MPSASITRAPTRPHSSSKWCHVSSISREPRSIQTQHGTYLSSAYRRNQPVESWPGYATARRASQILIDDFNIGKTMAPGNFDQIVLTALALQICVNLGLRGLAHVDDGFALDRRLRQHLSGHRRSPRLRHLPPASEVGTVG